MTKSQFEAKRIELAAKFETVKTREEHSQLQAQSNALVDAFAASKKLSHANDHEMSKLAASWG